MTLSTLLRSTRHAWAGDTVHGWKQRVVLPLHKSSNSYSFITIQTTLTKKCNISWRRLESISRTQTSHLRAEASRSAATPSTTIVVHLDCPICIVPIAIGEIFAR